MEIIIQIKRFGDKEPALETNSLETAELWLFNNGLTDHQLRDALYQAIRFNYEAKSCINNGVYIVVKVA